MESPTKDCPTNETTASTSLEKGADADSKKVTRIKYSDRNPSFFDHQSIEVKLNDEEIQCKQPLQTMTYLDDDYALSNELNEIVASNSAELHYFVFQNDIESVRNYIKRHKKEHPLQLKYYLSIRDKHGNTPMHLAAMLGHIDVIKLLIENGAFVKARNKQLWTPLNEAISYGNRELSKQIKSIIK
jgi:ankyrin repeat protein